MLNVINFHDLWFEIAKCLIKLIQWTSLWIWKKQKPTKQEIVSQIKTLDCKHFIYWIKLNWIILGHTE